MLRPGVIEQIDIGWLWASVSGPQTTFADLTFEEPNVSVVATTAVSAFSAGVYEHVPGSVASYVREYAVFTGPGLDRRRRRAAGSRQQRLLH